jgi:hypothetical protein
MICELPHAKVATDAKGLDAHGGEAHNGVHGSENNENSEAAVKNPFYLAAIVLGLVAVAFVVIASSEAARVSRLEVARLAAAEREHVRAAPDPEVTRLAHMGRLHMNTGMIMTGVSAVCVLVALIRRERGWYSIPLLLVFFAFLWRMMA